MDQTYRGRIKQNDKWMRSMDKRSLQLWQPRSRIGKMYGNITSLPKVIWKEGRVAALSHMHLRRKIPIGYNGAPQIHSPIPLPVDRSQNPTICLIPGPVRPMMPNGIRIRCAVFPQCTGQTDAPTGRPTHRPTDRPRESLITISRCAPRATRPKNMALWGITVVASPASGASEADR